MSGKDDTEKPTTKNDTPAADAKDASPSAIPEVEVEVVDEDEVAAAAVNDDPKPDTIDVVAEEVAPEAIEEPSEAKAKSGIAPGIVLVGVLGLFGVGIVGAQFLGGQDKDSAIEEVLSDTENVASTDGSNGDSAEIARETPVVVAEENPSNDTAFNGNSANGTSLTEDITSSVESVVADVSGESETIDLSSDGVPVTDPRVSDAAENEAVESDAAAVVADVVSDAAVDGIEEDSAVNPRAAIAALQKLAQDRVVEENDSSAGDGQAVEEPIIVAEGGTDAEGSATAVSDGVEAEIINQEAVITEAIGADEIDTVVVADAADSVSSDQTSPSEIVASEEIVADQAAIDEATVEVEETVTAGVGPEVGPNESVAANEEVTQEEVAQEAAIVAAGPSGKIVNEFAELKEAVQQRTAALDEALIADREKQAEELALLRDELASALDERERRSSEEIADLRTRIEKIQTGGLPAGRQAMAALALNALQQKVGGGGVFAEELDVLARLAPDAPVVSAVRPFANTGVPSVTSLADEFQAARRDAMKRSNLEDAKGPLSIMIANIKNLVSVRPAGPQQGDSIVAIISRAEANLEAGDIAEAVNETSSLDGEALDAFSGWLSKAQNTSVAMEAIREMNEALLNQFGEETPDQ